jgi:hypothetical protein
LPFKIGDLLVNVSEGAAAIERIDELFALIDERRNGVVELAQGVRALKPVRDLLRRQRRECGEELLAEVV